MKKFPGPDLARGP